MNNRESGNRGIGESGNRGIGESGNRGIGESEDFWSDRAFPILHRNFLTT